MGARASSTSCGTNTKPTQRAKGVPARLVGRSRGPISPTISRGARTERKPHHPFPGRNRTHHPAMDPRRTPRHARCDVLPRGRSNNLRGDPAECHLRPRMRVSQLGQRPRRSGWSFRLTRALVTERRGCDGNGPSASRSYSPPSAPTRVPVRTCPSPSNILHHHKSREALSWRGRSLQPIQRLQATLRSEHTSGPSRVYFDITFCFEDPPMVFARGPTLPGKHVMGEERFATLSRPLDGLFHMSPEHDAVARGPSWTPPPRGTVSSRDWGGQDGMARWGESEPPGPPRQSYGITPPLHHSGTSSCPHTER